MPRADEPDAPHRQAAETRFAARATRAVANRRVFRFLAYATLVLTFVAGALAWLVDREDFPTLGDALWWALVTLATVGYGDIVPHTGWGRLIGSAVIVLGVTFLSLLTAIVTSYVVSADQDARMAEIEALRGATDDSTRALLEELSGRLAAIEAAVTAPTPEEPR